MTLAEMPLWFWPVMALGAGVVYLYRRGRWPFDGPSAAPVQPPDPWVQLQSEIVRGVLAKQGLLPPIARTPTTARVIELPRRFVIVPMEEGESEHSRMGGER
jgi:hypothetical protein